MDFFGWAELVLFLGLLLLVTKPIGIFIAQVLETDGKTFLDPVLKPVEKIIYSLLRINPQKEQNWKEYTFSLLAFNLIGVLFTYVILRLQYYLPLNPEGFKGLEAHLAFNTAVSFVTHTNWQSYAGENTMSYFSQMVALVFQNFTAPAVALAVAAALVRGIARHTAETIGNFWTSIVRSILYLLLPLSIVFSLFLVSQGMVQNFSSYPSFQTMEGEQQKIAQGPMATQKSIALLGSNGGGFTGVNSSHPYENPTPLSNFFQIFSIFLLPCGLTYYLGRMVKKQRHGWAVWGAMALLFVIGYLVCWGAENMGNPRLEALGVDSHLGNLEGKEMRFGVASSSLYASVTTDTSCGAVDSMHDSYTPMGGLVLLLNLMLGCIIFGGTGTGLFSIIVFIVLTIFIAGLMIGRTPEYLGKKIEAYDVKASVIFVVTGAFAVLGFTSWAIVSKWGMAGLGNQGPHGFSEILYAYSEAVANNGSAFAGLNANTAWYDTTLAVAMLIGRYLMIIPVMALAGNLAKKKRTEETPGSFPVSGSLFALLLAVTIIIVGALLFFPALALGPLLEHFLMTSSNHLF